MTITREIIDKLIKSQKDDGVWKICIFRLLYDSIIQITILLLS